MKDRNSTISVAVKCSTRQSIRGATSGKAASPILAATLLKAPRDCKGRGSALLVYVAEAVAYCFSNDGYLTFRFKTSHNDAHGFL